MEYSGFDARTVLITGASKGIGAAIANELIKTDCRLVLTASRAESFKECQFEKERITILPMDLSKSEEMQTGIERLRTLNYKPDILINNAGVGIFKLFSEITMSEFDEMMNVNFRSPFFLTQAMIEDMSLAGFGLVANVLSVAAETTFTASSVYSASKAALLQAMKTLRKETRKKGIKIINFLPGATSTGIWSEKVLEESMHRMMSAESLAKVIVETINSAILHDTHIEEMTIRPQGGDL